MQDKVETDMQQMQNDLKNISENVLQTKEQKEAYKDIEKQYKALDLTQNEAFTKVKARMDEQKDHKSESEGDDDDEDKNNGFDDDMMAFNNHQFSEYDKFEILFEEWAKYMLRLDEYKSLKDFLNVVSGFDMVSSKSDYFVDNNNAFSMFSDVMDMMGEFDDEKDPMMAAMGMDYNNNNQMMQENAENPLMKTWETVNNFDIKKAAENKWNALRSYFDRDEYDDDEEMVFAEDNVNNMNENQDDNNDNKTFTDRMKNGVKSGVSNLTSWWSKK